MIDDPSSMTRSFEPIEGVNIRLRLVRGDDAAYIHGLRTNPVFNTHLSPTSGGVEQQRDWIERYKRREASGAERYYIIERRDRDQPCGTVRLYDIGANSFTWGSWILDHNKPRKAALESAVLSFGVGFEVLCLSLVNVTVRIGNTHAEAFYRRFGMTEIRRDQQDIHFTYSRSRFNAYRDNYLAAVMAASERPNA